MAVITDDMMKRAAEVFCENGIHISLPAEGDLDDIERERYETLKAALTAALSDQVVGWQPIEARPDIDCQPGRQFILIEGSRAHSGVRWYRQQAGEAFIRKPGADDEMLQYRISDVLRICCDGDIDVDSAKVTHWMPAAFPHFPVPASTPVRSS